MHTGAYSMVPNISPDGLIVSTQTATSPTLEEVASRCGWPTLIGANARMLLHELSLRVPACILFWLDDLQSVASTARLILWLRERNANPYRVAVACNLAGDAEAALRAAGAHSVLPIHGDSEDDAVESLLPLLQAVSLRNVTSLAASLSPADTPNYVPHMQYPSDLARPP
jgi:hypothetical protein